MFLNWKCNLKNSHGNLDGQNRAMVPSLIDFRGNPAIRACTRPSGSQAKAPRKVINATTEAPLSFVKLLVPSGNKT